jgi:hypothetical protein
VFVDDISFQVLGRDPARLAFHTAQAVLEFVDGLEHQLRLTIDKTSRGKTEVFSSSAAAAQKAAKYLASLGAVPFSSVRQLGIDRCGVKRNTTVQRGRAAKVKARAHRFQLLKRGGARVHRLIRTGVSSSLTYGVEVVGVTDAQLNSWRSTLGALLPGSSRCASTSIKFLVVDQAADPIHRAAMPILLYARAVWERWFPTSLLGTVFVNAYNAMRKASPPFTWRSDVDPISACIASAKRLGIRFEGPFVFRIGGYRSIDVRLDGFDAVRDVVGRAIHLWQCARAAVTLGLPKPANEYET